MTAEQAWLNRWQRATLAVDLKDIQALLVNRPDDPGSVTQIHEWLDACWTKKSSVASLIWPDLFMVALDVMRTSDWQNAERLNHCSWRDLVIPDGTPWSDRAIECFADFVWPPSGGPRLPGASPTELLSLWGRFTPKVAKGWAHQMEGCLQTLATGPRSVWDGPYETLLELITTPAVSLRVLAADKSVTAVWLQAYERLNRVPIQAMRAAWPQECAETDTLAAMLGDDAFDPENWIAIWWAVRFPVPVVPTEIPDLGGCGLLGPE